MLDAKETELVLDKFFKECWRYWKLKGHTERQSFIHALNDIQTLKRNPYDPNGDFLDIATKQKFIEYRRMDLRY